MISVAEAQQHIDGKVAALGGERVPLAQAHGRILSEPVASTEDMPPFDRSAMDGYAIRIDDDAKRFEVIEEIRAGQSIDLELKRGQAVRIFTGARLPGSGLKVVMQEDVEVKGKQLLITKPSKAFHVRKRGEDVRAGEILVQSGTVLDATALAVLASVGKAEPLVTKMPRIFHLTTGDEIVSPDQAPADGQIRNSNASLIAGLCREQEIESLTHLHVSDDLAELAAAMEKAGARSFDMVLISGGSGGGTYDYSAEMFKLLGAEIHFRSVNIRPGKPLIFGTTSSQIIFGLPGNAMSHFVCFHLFVRRALDRMMGRELVTTTRGFLTEPLAGTDNARETWWPVQTVLKDGRLECVALPWKSSGDITRLPAAGALMKVPASTSHFDAGTMVELLMTRPLSI